MLVRSSDCLVSEYSSPAHASFLGGGKRQRGGELTSGYVDPLVHCDPADSTLLTL